ncbi:hypothetical protein HA050_20865 [Iodobacter sp. HSC-16F04]|uniref:Uncharacterized protein n=1 Tax=Iodobacter violaceini TaxID=3044271 RepID=A0ABX0KXK4_9NEIS|nr:hypothetical protein [Iodobacter violacea]NHQ88554.1 hypothetical protein [Iodobacter violacea]
MNIIDTISNDTFLRKAYPEGFVSSVLLGGIELTIDNRVALSLHIKDQPKINVDKWGVWGKDYNVVAVHLTSNTLRRVDIKNWNSFISCVPEVKIDGDNFLVHFSSDDASVVCYVGGFIFQKCTTYIND